MITQVKGGPQDNGFRLIIEDKEFFWPAQYITGAEVRHLGALSSEQELYLAVTEPWEDQLVPDFDKINLGRPDIEHFYLKHDNGFTVNGKKINWPRQYITGAQVRKLGNISDEEELFLQIEKPGEDELILLDAKINLAVRGVEHFYGKEVNRKVTIIVNGTPKKWEKSEISFKQVIELAFGSYIDRPTMVYTVAYEDGPKQNPEGSLTKGKSVFVKNKMIFHATATDKS